jgi:Rne/Rng family ribonuclease
MQKELVIATTSQETKIAILEDDELVEYYIERHQSQGIVGNIYKGKVTKVLPGMQSAFVDIGLERDAFLYVSDFFEDTEEYEKIVSTVEDEVTQLQERGRSAAPSTLPHPALVPPPIPAAAEVVESESLASVPTPGDNAAAAPISEGAAGKPEDSYERRGGRRGERDRGRDRDRDRDRDRERRGKKPKIPSFEGKSYEPREERPREERPREERSYASSYIELLPGETLARYASRPETSDVSPEVTEVREQLEESGVDASAVHDTVPDLSRDTERDEITPTPSEDFVTPPEAPSVPQADEEASKDPTSSSARITDRSDNSHFAHRPSSRRQRRRGGPPPSGEKREEHVRSSANGPRTGPMISELLREGQEILVQVAKEPLGKKGARITSHIALPGRYLVFMPTVDHIGVSRKIASEEERFRLKRIIHENRNNLPGGFIVRTAAEGRGEDEFIQDLRFLGNLWSDIRSKSEKKAAPALIHRDLNLVQRILRDQLSPDFRAIRLDNETEFATVLDFVNKFQPALVNRVKLHLKDTPIFEEYGLNLEIDKALRPKVWLKSGGYIVINQTEALVAIDVNTGKFVGKSNRLEDTIVRTNLDAVNEIVRQIRLRNLGGIIVVDFIDMEEKKNRQRVMAALEEALRADRSPSKILQFNDFGLVAITRKRTQPSLERTICTPCSHCNGSGWIKSPETICYDIQQEVKKIAHLLEGKEITIRVNPEVAKVFKSGEFVSTHELEEWTKKDINIKSDPLLHEERFDIF